MTARLTAGQVLLRGILEKDWQVTVERTARGLGWLVYHAPDNIPRRSRSGAEYVQNVRAGFPDLVLVRRDRLVFAELKTETGKASPDQVEWLCQLRDTGHAEVYIWRPRQLAELTRILRDGL